QELRNQPTRIDPAKDVLPAAAPAKQHFEIENRTNHRCFPRFVERASRYARLFSQRFRYSSTQKLQLTPLLQYGVRSRSDTYCCALMANRCAIFPSAQTGKTTASTPISNFDMRSFREATPRSTAV